MRRIKYDPSPKPNPKNQYNGNKKYYDVPVEPLWGEISEDMLSKEPDFPWYKEGYGKIDLSKNKYWK